MTIIHVVLLQFKDGTPQETIRDAHHALESVQTNCLTSGTHKPYIRSVRAGANVSIEGLEGGINYAAVMEFETEADRDYYVKQDPAHAAVRDKLLGMRDEGVIVGVQVVDVEPGKI